MAGLMRLAVENIRQPSDHVGLPGMGGYFITRVENDMPPHTARIAEVGIDGARYMVYALLPR